MTTQTKLSVDTDEVEMKQIPLVRLDSLRCSAGRRDCQRRRLIISICIIVGTYLIWMSQRIRIEYTIVGRLIIPEHLLRGRDLSHLNQIKHKFLTDWQEITSAQFDVTHIQNGCNVTWIEKEAVPWLKIPDRTDPNLSYIALWDIRPAGEFSQVILNTQFPNGTSKHIGGDYWRVFVNGETSVPVIKKDYRNGSYQFKFFITEPGTYYLDIALEYTLCRGVKEPPKWWFQKGNIMGKEQPQGLLLGEVPYINKKLWDGSEVKFTVKADPDYKKDKWKFLDEACPLKRTDCLSLWNGFGRWINNKNSTTTWKPWCKDSSIISYPRKREGVIWFFGDSVSSKFYYSVKKHRLCKEVFRLCLYTYNWIYSLENYNVSLGHYVRINSTLVKKTWDTLGYNVTKALEDLKQALYHPAMDAKSVLILNYGLHYTEATTFQEFQSLIEGVIQLRGDPNVKCQIVWRSTTSLNRHKYSMPNLHSRRFMTSQRVQLYNAYATDTFCKAGFPILDVYPFTDSYPYGTGSAQFPSDPVHYENHVMMPVADVLARVYGSSL